MKRFFDRIRQKALDVDQPPVLIVAFGDSNTQGVMAHKLLEPEGVYHRFLQQDLEEFYPTTTFSTINAGVSGDSAGQAIHRLKRDVIGHHPDLVLVAFGTNDAVGGGRGRQAEFKESLTRIVSQIGEQTEADVVLLTPPFMATRMSPWVHPDHLAYIEPITRIQNEGTLAHYADAIREVAEVQNVLLADVHREWVRLSQTGVDTDLWLSNGLNHPDKRGHRLSARVIFQALLSRRNA